jgi:hypothetical protein
MVATTEKPVADGPRVAGMSPLHARLLRAAAVRLSRELDGEPSAASVESLMVEEYARLAEDARVKDFLPVFAERAVRERCRAVR